MVLLLYLNYNHRHYNMKKPKISIIVAIGEQNRAIGKNNELLWHITADLKRFKELTSGHPVIMGQNTWESLPEKFRPLPNRINIILTLNKQYEAEGAHIANSISEAIDVASSKDKNEIFFIGGASVYAQALPLSDKLYVTEVDGDYDGDTFFPDYSGFGKEISRENHEENGIKFSFVEIERPER